MRISEGTVIKTRERFGIWQTPIKIENNHFERWGAAGCWWLWFKWRLNVLVLFGQPAPLTARIFKQFTSKMLAVYTSRRRKVLVQIWFNTDADSRLKRCKVLSRYTEIRLKARRDQTNHETGEIKSVYWNLQRNRSRGHRGTGIIISSHSKHHVLH